MLACLAVFSMVILAAVSGGLTGVVSLFVMVFVPVVELGGDVKDVVFSEQG